MMTLVAAGRTQAPYTIVEVLPGLRLALLPGEDLAQVAALWTAHLDETERRPGMADALTDEEAAALGLTDEHYRAALATAPAWVCDEDEVPGEYEYRHRWMW